VTKVRVVAAVIVRDGRYLLGRRPAAKRHGGLWEFPGGKVDEEESPSHAASRELREELSLHVTSVGARVAAIDDAESPFVIEFYDVVAAGEPLAHEHDELGWFTATELQDVALAPADRLFAQLLLKQSEAS
jgi:8-oxo-dGTP diphosphatase